MHEHTRAFSDAVCAGRNFYTLTETQTGKCVNGAAGMHTVKTNLKGSRLNSQTCDVIDTINRMSNVYKIGKSEAAIVEHMSS